MMKRLMAGLAAMVLATGVQARDGDFDTSFGNQGRDQYGFAPDLDVVISFVGFVDVVEQPDGRLLMSATVGNAGSDDFGVLRLNANGTLDTNFGDQGQVILPFDLGGDLADVPTTILRQPNGRILLCGGASGDPSAGGKDFAFARLLANGDPDPGFSGDGRATVALDLGAVGSRDDQAIRCILQPDGKIVAVGTAMLDVGGPVQRTAVVRLNPDGSRDTTFNGSGTATIDFGASYPVSTGFGIALLPDGGVVTIGAAQGAGGSRWSLAKLDQDGQLDSDFGNGGIVLFDPGIVGYVPSLALDLFVREDGSFVATGALALVAGDQQMDYALFAFDADGHPDPSFGNGGGIVVPFDIGDSLTDVPVEISRDASGRFVAVGFVASTIGQYTIGVMRVTPDGQLDPSFGNGGKLTVATAPPPAVDLGDQGTAFTFTRDHGIVVASLANTAQGVRAGLAKLHADGIFADGFGQ